MDDASIAQLASVLEAAVADAVDGPVSVAFSGGIDSSLVAMLASRYVEVELLAAGTPGAHDLTAAEESAALLNLNIVLLEISPTQMAMAGHELAATAALSWQEVEFLLPFWLVAREATHPLLLCGQGADELFGGYARFRRDGTIPNLAAAVVELQARLPQREQVLARHFGRHGDQQLVFFPWCQVHRCASLYVPEPWQSGRVVHNPGAQARPVICKRMAQR